MLIFDRLVVDGGWIERAARPSCLVGSWPFDETVDAFNELVQRNQIAPNVFRALSNRTRWLRSARLPLSSRWGIAFVAHSHRSPREDRASQAIRDESHSVRQPQSANERRRFQKR